MYINQRWFNKIQQLFKFNKDDYDIINRVYSKFKDRFKNYIKENIFDKSIHFVGTW